ncbi:hypothetical protein V9T40_004280 [Parthenolecanium corni]|uniref:Uncharacterized protein n=1 Tax=Parthenolecanium corni TaxID=536013 RepID=A0AAN9YAL8_9HEMI
MDDSHLCEPVPVYRKCLQTYRNHRGNNVLCYSFYYHMPCLGRQQFQPLTLPTYPQTQSHKLISQVPEAFTYGSLEEDVFGPTLGERSDRKKRLLYDTLKKAKQAKLLTLGSASSSVAKKVGKSVLKTVATLGVKAILFNFLFSKINQVLDFKTRLLNNLEHKNREQNSQVGIGDASTADSNINTTTEFPVS